MSPFRSKRQVRAAFGGYLGPEMKRKAKQWAAETPNLKGLPERARPTRRRSLGSLYRKP